MYVHRSHLSTPSRCLGVVDVHKSSETFSLMTILPMAVLLFLASSAQTLAPARTERPVAALSTEATAEFCPFDARSRVA
jgi:hypothetical protein